MSCNNRISIAWYFLNVIWQVTRQHQQFIISGIIYFYSRKFYRRNDWGLIISIFSSASSTSYLMLTVSATSCLPLLLRCFRKMMVTMLTTITMKMIDPTVAPIISSMLLECVLIFGNDSSSFGVFGIGPSGKITFPVLVFIWFWPTI